MLTGHYTRIALRRVMYSSPYCFAKTASKVRWSKDDSFLQGCCRFHCRFVDLSVERKHDVEPRSIVSRHASVLNFTLEVEVREAGVSHESDVVYELRFVTERRRRWYAGVQHYKQRQDGGSLRCAEVQQNVWHGRSTMASQRKESIPRPMHLTITKSDPGFESKLPDFPGSIFGCPSDCFENVVHCQRQLFRRDLWKVASNCMKSANLPKFPILQ